MRFTVLFMISMIFMISASYVYFPDSAEAKKSHGSPASVINSKNVCGLELCDKPMTIEEKISAYLYELSKKYNVELPLQQGRFSVGGFGFLFN